MTFADMPAGALLLIDANTFVYHFSPHAVFEPACTDIGFSADQSRSGIYAPEPTHINMNPEIVAKGISRKTWANLKSD